MTKTIFILLLGVSLFMYPRETKAQRFTFGEYTGVNFSNLHGNLTSNKWESKAGPSAGFFIEYKLGRLFAVQSEIGFISQYYEMKTYEQKNYYPVGIPYDYSSSYQPISGRIAPPYYELSNWDFSFLRFPLILKYQTPTRLQLGAGGGLFYSVLMNDERTKAERKSGLESGHPVYPSTHDWGYLFVADLSYPVTKELRLFLAGRLSTGKKVFIERYSAKNGASELLFGIKFTPERRDPKVQEKYNISVPDTSFSRCYLKSGLGVTMAWNPVKKLLGNYSEKFGANAGLIFGYRLDKTVSLQTGFQFQQKGYAFSDSSYYNHRYATDLKKSGQFVDSNVNLDYMTVPLNVNFSFGEKIALYVDLGIYAEFLLNANCTGTTIKEYRNGSDYRKEKHNLHDAVEGYYEPVDFGFLGGMGIQFPFRDKIKFDLGIQYANGSKNILKKPGEYNFKGYYDDQSFKNRSLSLKFGLQIPIPN
ncbi:MAG: outer membrane beta-barrel protein [Bacteroidota bacterium]|nr:outer membrane beta-barrel protein [Bacteroidota bacterium]